MTVEHFLEQLLYDKEAEFVTMFFFDKKRYSKNKKIKTFFGKLVPGVTSIE